VRTKVRGTRAGASPLSSRQLPTRSVRPSRQVIRSCRRPSGVQRLAAALHPRACSRQTGAQFHGQQAGLARAVASYRTPRSLRDFAKSPTRQSPRYGDGAAPLCGVPAPPRILGGFAAGISGRPESGTTAGRRVGTDGAGWHALSCRQKALPFG
jgi:hypothetical protein